MPTIDRLHRWAVAQPLLRLAAVLTRVLLALAFLPSGLVKVLGQPFTQLPVTDPVGAFFAGFFVAHDYYRFVGMAQWTAAALLLAPRTAFLGAVAYFPIILNIAVITASIGPSFAGTRVVTAAMLAGNVALLAWDWDRWRGLLRPADDATRHGRLAPTLLLFAAAGLAFFAVTRAHVARLAEGSYAQPSAVFVLAVALGVTGVTLLLRPPVTGHRRSR